MKILLTGAAGFIGSHTVEALLAKGIEVRVLDHLNPKNRVNLDHICDQISLVKGDIRNEDDCIKAFVGFDAVLHLAGIVSVPLSISHPLQDQSVNLVGSLKLLRLSKETGIKNLFLHPAFRFMGNQMWGATLKQIPCGL